MSSVPSNNPTASSANTSITEALLHVKQFVAEKRAPASIGRDGYPSYPEDPFAAQHIQLDEYLGSRPTQGFFQLGPALLPKGNHYLKLPSEEKLGLLRAVIQRVLFVRGDLVKIKSAVDRARLFAAEWLGTFKKDAKGRTRMDPEEFRPLTSALLKANLAITADDLTHMLCLVADNGKRAELGCLSPDIVLRATERFVEQNELPAEVKQELQRWKESFGEPSKASSPERKILTRINSMVDQPTTAPIIAGEAWSNAALQELQTFPASAQASWFRLLHHCLTAETSKPSQKWLETTTELVDAVGVKGFRIAVLHWFELVALPRPLHQAARSQHAPDPDQLITDSNSVILKGLVWSCCGRSDSELSRGISTLAQVCFKKVRNLGARCPRVGNACLYVLGQTPTEEAAAELTRLGLVLKQASAKKLLGKSLDTAAERTGQTREELEESTVPDYDLDAEGCCKQPIGNFTAEFRIFGPEAFALLWRKQDGSVQKSVPVEVSENLASELKALKRKLRDVEKMLTAQRHRLEHLLLSERQWPYEKWRRLYLDHPLLADLTRRLIWHFEDGPLHQSAGIWSQGQIVGPEDQPLSWLSHGTRVRLWHPLGQPIDSVRLWREWLESQQITQPFKQAHREIYVLTDAELRTETYSNRFAAHLIRQHQFTALAHERGWRYTLQGNFDSHNVPTLTSPQWSLAVEFWVESADGENATSDAGIFLYLATDQVRFCDDAGVPRLLRDVPALVFSEVMRDIDLFVGVCSVGNDPNWHDRGAEGAYHGYWAHYAFGELTAMAKTRREVLDRLLPRLRIADRCELADKFLVVRGSLRTYKIHLGSSNIMMEPNNSYLCIVPDASKLAQTGREKVFLPFEGDTTLAVILSKAFLLAEDTKIKDESIRRQILER